MYRQEYPRPNFVRDAWINLNGKWDFSFDDENIGHVQEWYQSHDYQRKIEVPFCFQSKLSGIHELGFHDHVWYRRHFVVPPKYKELRTLINFGAVDYQSEIYVNGRLAATHVGGHTSFSQDITDYLVEGENELVVYAHDPSTNKCIARGKQYWQEVPESIWYHRTTGIWQTVWLEFVPKISIEALRMIPDIDAGKIDIELELSDKRNGLLEIEVQNEGEEVLRKSLEVNDKFISFSLNIIPEKSSSSPLTAALLWSPENPHLYEISFKLQIEDESQFDSVFSYFGMRKIEAKDGLLYLNNRPYFQKLILDQGYYPEGLLTAKTDSDLKLDIELAKSMGFNGCRKHQVVSDPRFLYHADKIGYLVWGEMANAFDFCYDYKNQFIDEWLKAVKRDINHPSVVAWVPLNESWGVPDIYQDKIQQDFSVELYELTKKIDPSRPVISNDGWEMTVTDICCIHNYRHGDENEIELQTKFRQTLASRDNILSYYPAGRSIYAKGFNYHGEPIVLSEFGGIAFRHDANGWGYTAVKSETEFLSTYGRLLEDIKASACLAGFCYTQLTDVFQETNGLLTFDRKPKADVEKIRSFNDLIKTTAT